MGAGVRTNVGSLVSPRPAYTGTVEAPKASEHDRDYMRRLGEFEREGREEWMRYLESLSLDERVRRSFARTEAGQPYERKEPEDLAAIYTRAKRLGLYRA